MGITPLCWAAMVNDPEATRLLIRSGADVDATNDDGGTPLHAAAFLGRFGVVEILLESGADTSLRNRDGGTALDGASAPWDAGIAGIIQWVGGQLRLEVDIEEVKEGRRESVELIKARDRADDETQDAGNSNTG